MIRRPRAILSTVIFAVLPLSAHLARADELTVTLTIKDHRFVPEEVEIPAGTKVKLVVKNEDASAEEFESFELNREKVIAGNGQDIVYVGPLKAGIYPFFGDFNPATAKGRIIAK